MRYAPELVKSNLLTETSVSMFEMFCREFAHYLRYADYVTGEPLFIESDGSAQRRYRNPSWAEYRDIQKAAFALGLEFGLTPAALQRAGGASGDSEQSPWQKVMS